MAYITRDQTRALEEACRLVGQSRNAGDPRAVRTYVTEEAPDGLGQSRVYYVDQLPLGEDKKLVRVYDMVERRAEGKVFGTRYVIEEVPV